MKSYYRVMLGKKSIYAQNCFDENFIGADFGVDQDLTGKLQEEWRTFIKKLIPIYLANHPEKTKIGAGLACGALWTVAKGIQKGDIILSPDGTGVYRVGEICGDYFYKSEQILPHRRAIRWLPNSIARSSMSEALQNSTGAIGTLSNITDHGKEIEQLLAVGELSAGIIATDPVVEDPAAFALEKHLEDFLVKNWNQTELGHSYSIYSISEDEGQAAGQQYQTDVGAIDILAISKNAKRLLVIELKRGRASDVVVGQILRYMGYVKEELAAPDQIVEGMIIALEDDQKLRRALSVVPSISFYRYQIDFKLIKS